MRPITAEVKAVIDVGTNSIKFLAAEKTGAGGIRVLKDANNVARLGRGLRETGRLAPDALERAAAMVEEYAEAARGLDASEIALVGTMALRVAENTPAFAQRVSELARLDLRVISGEEEARLSYIAATLGMDDRSLVTFDVGGGSTELVFGRGETILRKFSLDLGALWLTERFFIDDPVALGSVEAADALIKKGLTEGGVSGGRGSSLVGMGGAVTTLASVKRGMTEYDSAAIQNSTLTMGDVAAQIADYAEKTLEERGRVAGLHPRRVDVILAGACVVRAIMDTLGVQELTVSVWGLRHGLMYEMMRTEKCQSRFITSSTF
ncbi:MAG: Ppx/GppA family phosphatase [Synergistaceae bacterium]|jgi:exopolyphosphatase/guanosine-5'-triphosphate,3'-diphosphate pyrophosphatase|nr:Ppx/GppA family phosphatase [Synergistaceae bacterium]